MKSILTTTDLTSLLNSIQPISPLYLALQEELKSNLAVEDQQRKEMSKTIIVNMERARWKQDFDASNMVYVHIPAFKLVVFKEGKSVINMKVVVGETDNERSEVRRVGKECISTYRL